MTDWGLPDWRDAASYGIPHNWDWHRWRWEFYRRREDLRKYFDERAEQTYRSMKVAAAITLDENSIPAPDQPGFLVPCDIGLFGYTGVPNPRISQQPASVLLSISGTSSYVACYPGEHYSDLGFALESESQIAFVFELSRPLNRQIDQARRVLEKHQIAAAGKLLQPRLHKTKWLTYLRALDAEANGVYRSEFALILSNTAQSAHTSRDCLEQAKALRLKF